jgi:hypothetical protein
VKVADRIAALEAYEAKFKQPTPFCFGMTDSELDKVAQACKAAVARGKALTAAETGKLAPKRDAGVVL